MKTNADTEERSFTGTVEEAIEALRALKDEKHDSFILMTYRGGKEDNRNRGECYGANTNENFINPFVQLFLRFMRDCKSFRWIVRISNGVYNDVYYKGMFGPQNEHKTYDDLVRND